MEVGYVLQLTFLTTTISNDNCRVKGSLRQPERIFQNLALILTANSSFVALLNRKFNAFFFKSTIDPIFYQRGKGFPPILRQQHTLLQNKWPDLDGFLA